MTLESQVGQVNSDSQEWVLVSPRFPLVREKQLQTTLSFLAPEERRLGKASSLVNGSLPGPVPSGRKSIFHLTLQGEITDIQGHSQPKHGFGQI